MTYKIGIKICGLKEQYAIESSVENEVDMLGFVFYEDSPRNLDFSLAKKLFSFVPSNVTAVALLVNPTDDYLKKIINDVGINTIQLHGQETAERTAEIKGIYNFDIIKAFSVKNLKSIQNCDLYKESVSKFLFDAEPPLNSLRPGGNGNIFDWKILKNYTSNVPWILSGGLNPDNIKDAIEESGTNFVDVSSGVESKSGIKDIGLINKFVKNARK
ncbi:phosphoribosylanthranilate isomerase [Hyphomicrobiales bacterium]|jgi:phosphoribosylanthranilate isomerase|nr:phosphoribosylanthranilate isomerase [Hyphomicrobiales bacterium]